jgi:hypothetical protein
MLCMKELDIPKSGKRGVVVCYKSPYGQVSRQYVVPRDPHTEDQMVRRAAFGRARFLWRTLTQEQRLAWVRLADGRYTRTRLLQSGRLSGYLLFVQINCNLAAIGLPMVMDPPAEPKFPDNPVGRLLITNTNDIARLQLEVLGTPTGLIIVSGARPRSAGTTYVDHFTILGVLPDPEQGLSNFTDLYLAKWARAPVGSRIFIRTVQQIDGWQDVPTETSAIVPAPTP